jgi:agmatinase
MPYDATSTFRKGAAYGPQEIRKASWNFETFNLNTGVDLGQLAIHDAGDIIEKGCSQQVLQKTVIQWTSKVIAQKKLPLVLGGEHSITSSIVQAFPKDIVVLALDAHLDFRQDYEGDPYNHACVLRRVSDHIPPSSIAVLGVRSAEQQEYKEAQNQQMFIQDAFTIHKKGWTSILQETQQIIGKKPVYLTIDIDVVDPCYAPGTSTPEPFGITPFDVIECIETFAAQIVGCDLVEVCPTFDHGQTALLAARFLRWILDAISRSKT